jgi:hypothetical protein
MMSFMVVLIRPFYHKKKCRRLLNVEVRLIVFYKHLILSNHETLMMIQIVYLLEDDYLHRPGWSEVMLEGFDIKSHYLTLYDFDFFIAKGYLCEIFTTPSSHWRAVPATTNTFACRYKTLLEDLEVHQKHSINGVKEEEGFHFSKDYDKFWELQKQERYLISPMPGWSTHCDENHISPIIDWKKVVNETYVKEQKPISLSYK